MFISAPLRAFSFKDWGQRSVYDNGSRAPSLLHHMTMWKLERSWQEWISAIVKKQGRIHGYPSRVRVGRSRSLGHLGRSCMLKMLKNAKKVTSHPRIAHGQRYPMPCWEWSSEEVEWQQGRCPVEHRGKFWDVRPSVHPEGAYFRL